MKKSVNTSTVSPNNNGNNNNKNRIKIKIMLTLRLTQNNQWVGIDHAARMHLVNSPLMTSSIEKNKRIMIMTMMIQTIMAKEK